MMQIPNDPKKIKNRINSYERSLRQEKQKFGGYMDGAGKRYLIGPLYLLLDDTAGALKAFKWFEKTFPDDTGEPFFFLCWTLALFRAGKLAAASEKLGQTMLSNLYLMPHLLGEEQPELPFRSHSNEEEKRYLQYLPPEFLALWDEEALAWAKAQYHSPELRQARERYIEIEKQLESEPVGPKRSELVQERSKLRRWE